MKRRWRVVLGSAGLLCVAELALRSLSSERLKLQSRPTFYAAHPTHGYGYEPLAEGHVSVPNIDQVTRTNTHGYPGPDFSAGKPAGIYRVMVIAPSHACGTWLPGSRHYSWILRTSIEDLQLPIEVIDCTVDGPRRGPANLRQAEDLVTRFAADLVFVALDYPLAASCPQRESYRGYVFETGHRDMDVPVLDRNRSRIHEMIDDVEGRASVRLLKWSFVARAGAARSSTRPDLDASPGLGQALNIVREKRISTVAPVRDLSREQAVELIRGTRRRIVGNGAELLVLASDAETIAFCKEFRIGFVDLQSLDLPVLGHQPDRHLEPQGHVTLALGLIPPLVGLWERSRESDSPR